MKTLKTLYTIALLLLGSETMAQRPSFQAALTPLYLSLKDALVADDASAATQAANALLQTLDNSELAYSFQNQQANLKGSITAFKKSAAIIAKSKQLDEQRKAFETMSTAYYQILKSERSLENTLYYQYCPMKKAYWLSTEKAIKNPYYGKQMLQCGQTKDTLQ